jgi:hypothetical protein
VALELEPSPVKGGGLPGSSALEPGSVVVVVVELARVELVASGRVVDEVLLVARVVVVVALVVTVVAGAVAEVVVAAAAETTTTPRMASWSLHR